MVSITVVSRSPRTELWERLRWEPWMELRVEPWRTTRAGTVRVSSISGRTLIMHMVGYVYGVVAVVGVGADDQKEVCDGWRLI